MVPHGAPSSTVAISLAHSLPWPSLPELTVHNMAINIGANTENYQVRDVGDQVQRLIPSAKINYTGEVGADPRNYRVRFDLLYRLLPDF